jgi:hypothetical protein
MQAVYMIGEEQESVLGESSSNPVEEVSMTDATLLPITRTPLLEFILKYNYLFIRFPCFFMTINRILHAFFPRRPSLRTILNRFFPPVRLGLPGDFIPRRKSGTPLIAPRKSI